MSNDQKMGYIFLAVIMLAGTAVLAALKLTNVLAISWWLVFAPIWGVVGFFLAIFIAVYITIVISDLAKEIRK